MSTELKTKIVVCRKDHKCEWCNGDINSGEEAVSRAYIWEGDFISGHQHPECFGAMELSSEDIDEWGFEQGSLDRGKTYAESTCNQ